MTPQLAIVLVVVMVVGSLAAWSEYRRFKGIESLPPLSDEWEEPEQ